MRAHHGWTIIALFVTIWDIACPPGHMLSDGMDRLRTTRPILAYTAVGIVVNHLLRGPFPDPIRAVATLAARNG
ncbi:hypothetical protein [Gordonia sp. NB41Y]|uniref:DUF7427 family protein n=1 Tax=Gordonia sp. NB41Y TaxID=875808 RepID=UPI0002BF0104|nr:hypothetical protein [Gordonia sp. NB41Y]WLP90243.1 hypothetical protein Q9K23_22460 [Gordonia sp. NB41Y]